MLPHSSITHLYHSEHTLPPPGSSHSTMFNAPRRTNPSLAQSAFLNSAGSSYPDPLASSTPNPGTAGYGDVDPWSGLPSPTRSGTPRRDSEEAITQPDLGAGGGFGGEAARAGDGGGLNGLIGVLSSFLPFSLSAKRRQAHVTADPPALYLSLLDQMDTTPSGDVSISSVHRLLSTSKLPAAAIERVSSAFAHRMTQADDCLDHQPHRPRQVLPRTSRVHMRSRTRRAR